MSDHNNIRRAMADMGMELPADQPIPAKLAADMAPTKVCRNCGHDDLQWELSLTKTNAVADGRLCMRDVQIIAALACPQCSETMGTKDGEAFFDRLLTERDAAREAVRVLREAADMALNELSPLVMTGGRVRLCEKIRTALDSTKDIPC